MGIAGIPRLYAKFFPKGLHAVVSSAKMLAVAPRSRSKDPKALGLSPAAAKLRLLKRLRCTLKFEKRAWGTGARLVAGADEVGRGSLFGPVVAAAVILDPAYRIRDSHCRG